MNLSDKKIAIICDWISDWWGAELVLSHLLEIFPQADIFTSVFWQQENPVFQGKNITTSFIQHLPLFWKSHKLALLLRPLAFESFDLKEYDIVISSSSAESKWVITKPTTLHICYCHTPVRYFWSHYHEYLKMMEFWIFNVIAKAIAPRIIYKLRLWDFIASKRPDFYIANSQNVAKRISKYYRRESEVIYPWIQITDYKVEYEKKNYYLAVGRCIPYKKFDLLIDTFNKNGKELVLVTNTENALFRSLQKKSKENILWKTWVKKEELNKLYGEARCFLFPPEEDFGLTPIEAMACGTPIIAYRKWGALETVVEWETGLFFDNQTITSLQKTIEEFEEMSFDPVAIRNHAKTFDVRNFKEKIGEFIEEKLHTSI
jgi:glycosyltransferase involved in cell wall biosynthesis